MLGNGIPLGRAPFDHPIGNIMVQMLYKAKMVGNYNTKMVDDAKMLDGALPFPSFQKSLFDFA